MPGTTAVMPSSLVIDRSDCDVRMSVSVALLLVGLVSDTPAGGLTVAVFVRLPVAEGSTCTVKVGDGMPADRRSWPACAAGWPVTTPPLSVAVHVAVVTPAGASTPGAADGARAEL